MIFVSDDYVVEESSTVVSEDGQPTFLLSFSHLNDLTTFLNLGVVRATFSAAATAIQYDWVVSGEAAFENRGTVEAISTSSAIALYIPSVGPDTVINSGLISAQAHSSTGFRSYWGLTFTNTSTGVLSAQSSDWQVRALDFYNGGVILNEGTIDADGYTHAYAIRIRNFQNGYIENSGTISATARSPTGQAYGIAVTLFDHVIPLTGPNIVNRGTITAEMAIISFYDGQSPMPSPTDWILNEGQIYGNIDVNRGTDIVQNSGIIVGDVLLGTGNDTFDGRGGSLVGDLHIGAGDDTAWCGDNNDRVWDDGGNDWIDAGGGNDFVRAWQGTDQIFGGGGDDELYGGSEADMLDGGDGDDLLNGGSGADVITGGEGRDTADYADSSNGVSANLHTGAGAGGDADGDTLISIEDVTGSAFNDTFVSSTAANAFDGGAGADTVSYAHATSAVIIDLASGASWDGTVNDTFVSIENAIGSAFNDTFYGTNGDNTFTGGLGADTLLGADGVDTADYAPSNTGVTVNFRAGAGSGGDAQGDTYSLIENAIGSAFADTFVSSAAVNSFTGGAGRDTISYAGTTQGVIVNMQAGLTWDGVVNDVISGIENITGGAGADQLWGDAGDNLIDGGVGGADVLAGFGGFDTVSYANSATGVIIDMGSSLTWDGVVNDQLHAFHGAIGSAHNDDFRGTGGVDVLDGGAGQDLYLGNDDADTFVFRAGQANGDTVVDFAGQGAVTGDSFVFVGYGAGATFTQIDATHWLITSGNGLITETITLANAAAVHASDYTFVDSYIVGGG